MNPWRKSFNQITWGFLLTMFTFNFLLLQYILPTIGVALLYLGFRSLRTVNRWFYATWILATIKLIGQVVLLGLYTTPFVTYYQNNHVINIIIMVLQIALLIAFRDGIQIFYCQAGIKITRDPILWLIIWNCLMTVCALLSIGNVLIISLPLIILLLMIIHSLYKVGDDIGEEDYVFVNVPMKRSNDLVVLGYFIGCIIMVSTCCLFSNHIKLKATEQVVMTESETRANLIQLGFPKNILRDISDKDVSKLEGAVRIDSFSNTLMFNSAMVTNQTGIDSYSTNSKPGNGDLQATTIYIEFPHNQLYVIEYFDWMKNKVYWQDGFSISAYYECELLNGALLFKKNGADYLATIPRLKCGTVTSYDFFGANTSKTISGAVSYPYDSEKQRGYVFYRLMLPNGTLAGGTVMNYMHFKHPLQFPYVETEKRLLSGNYSIGKNMLQHYTCFETHAYQDGVK